MVSVLVVAAPPGHEEEVERITGAIAGLPGERGAFHPIVVAGGATRAASVGLGLAELPGRIELVAVHDAARPLVTAELIERLISRLAGDPGAAGVIAAAPLTDTVKRVADETGAIAATEDRTRLWAAQTPQVFRAEALRDAHGGDPDLVEAATDDAILIEGAGGRVLVEETRTENLKVTTRADLRLAELLLADR
jgi:2-C-methyl-D-erythritol 4-phosphate cytidylyltransferase